MPSLKFWDIFERFYNDKRCDGFDYKYQTEFSSGVDLFACSSDVKWENSEWCIEPQKQVVIGTGLKIKNDFRVRNLRFDLIGRSSLSKIKQMHLSNGVGIIDCDFNQEIKGIVFNYGSETRYIKHGEKFCQIFPTFFPLFLDLDNFGERNGGFGSTGS